MDSSKSDCRFSTVPIVGIYTLVQFCGDIPQKYFNVVIVMISRPLYRDIWTEAANIFALWWHYIVLYVILSATVYTLIHMVSLTLQRTFDDGRPPPLAGLWQQHAAADALPHPAVLALLMVSHGIKGHDVRWREMAQNHIHLWHR